MCAGTFPSIVSELRAASDGVQAPDKSMERTGSSGARVWMVLVAGNSKSAEGGTWQRRKFWIKRQAVPFSDQSTPEINPRGMVE